MSLKYEPASEPLPSSLGSGGWWGRPQGRRKRGGLESKAHKLVYHSTLGLRAIKKKKKKKEAVVGGGDQKEEERDDEFGPLFLHGPVQEIVDRWIHPSRPLQPQTILVNCRRPLQTRPNG